MSPSVTSRVPGHCHRAREAAGPRHEKGNGGRGGGRGRWRGGGWGGGEVASPGRDNEITVAGGPLVCVLQPAMLWFDVLCQAGISWY